MTDAIVDGKPVDLDEAQRQFAAAMAAPEESLAEYKAWKPRKIPERKPGQPNNLHAQLYQAVKNMLAERGWIYHGCENARGCDGLGFVDLVIITPAHPVFVELKAHRGSSWEPWQTTWKYALLACGADWRVWYYDDWQSGEIQRQLDLLAKRGDVDE
jgi:hypothetical protein